MTDTTDAPVNWLNETMYGGVSIPPGDYNPDLHDKADRAVRRRAHLERHIVTNIRRRYVDGWWVHYYLQADIHGLRCPSYGVNGFTAFSACEMPEGHAGEHAAGLEVWDEPFDDIIVLAEHSKQRHADELAAGSTR